MYEVFIKLLSQKGITAYKVGKETGIAASTFSDWKSGRSTPKQDKLQKIADYLGVSIEYLTTGEEKEKLSYFIDDEAREIAQELLERPDLKILFDASRKVSAEDLKAVVHIVEQLTNDKN